MDMWLMIFSAVFCSLWIFIYLFLMYTGRNLTFFHNLVVTSPKLWPKLSIIVPACNEEQHIEQAVQTLIAQDYPELEIILVNDRSTDNTGEIIDSLASDDARIKAVHIDTLPDNWLGKVHALSEGKKHVTGNWLLITDADIHYAPGLLRKAVAYVEEKKIDHLALMPNVEMNSFWLEMAISTFGLLFLLTTRAAGINKPGSKAVIGVGAFNLVKCESFDKTPGFQWLRMETVDDMGVGLMMKNAGGQTHFVIADKDLSLGWYNSVAAMFRGLEKNLFGAGPGYSVVKLIFQLLPLWALVVAPFIAFCSDNVWLLSLASVATFLYVFFAIFFIRKKQSETFSLLLFPVGLILISLMMMWAAYRCVKNRGIDWRGTHYSIDQLRAGQRVRFK